MAVPKIESTPDHVLKMQVQWQAPYRLITDSGRLLTTPNLGACRCWEEANVYNDMEGLCYRCGWEAETVEEALRNGASWVDTDPA